MFVGATHGVLHHFWTTGGQHQIDRIHVHYYIDGEKTPSISFQPALMCGQAFPELIDQKFLYHAGQLCGKSAPGIVELRCVVLRRASDAKPKSNPNPNPNPSSFTPL